MVFAYCPLGNLNVKSECKTVLVALDVHI